MRLESTRAFTLTETLVVLAIAAVLMALAVPAVNTVVVSSRLTSSANIVAEQLALARQIATTRSCRVEVRFYQPTRDGNRQYCAMRAFQISDTGAATPLGKIKELPAPIIISEKNEHTTMKRTGSLYNGTEDLPKENNVPYFQFSFTSAGRTDFDVGSNWFLTLLPEKYAAATDTQLSGNYIVMQIDDFTGHVRSFRP